MHTQFFRLSLRLFISLSQSLPPPSSLLLSRLPPRGISYPVAHFYPSPFLLLSLSPYLSSLYPLFLALSSHFLPKLDTRLFFCHSTLLVCSRPLLSAYDVLFPLPLRFILSRRLRLSDFHCPSAMAISRSRSSCAEIMFLLAHDRALFAGEVFYSRAER